jgi:hypothetical protein
MIKSHLNHKILLGLTAACLASLPIMVNADPLRNHEGPCFDKIHRALEGKGYKLASAGVITTKEYRSISFKWNAEDEWIPCVFTPNMINGHLDGYRCGSAASFRSGGGVSDWPRDIISRDGQEITPIFIGGKTFKCSLSKAPQPIRSGWNSGSYEAGVSYSAVYKYLIKIRGGSDRAFYFRDDWKDAPTSAFTPPPQF